MIKFSRSLAGFCLLLILTVPALQAQFQFEHKNIDPSFAPAAQYTPIMRATVFNRVQGLQLNAGLQVRPPKATGLLLEGWLGLGTSADNDKFRYAFAVEQEISLESKLILGARFEDVVTTRDRWMLSDLDNSLNGLLLHRDYLNWFGRQGGLVFADYQWRDTHILRAEVNAFEYKPIQLQPAASWSLFSFLHDREFSVNPVDSSFQFVPGDETGVRLGAIFDFRDNPLFPISGWQFEVLLEKSFRDFETSGLFLTTTYFRPMWGNQRLRMQMRLGSRSGSFARQHLISLGGPGALRGHAAGEVVGNRALAATLQYAFGGDLLQKLPLQSIPFYDALTMGVFVDVGHAWFADPLDAGTSFLRFENFSASDLASDVGVSLLLMEGFVRFDFARRTDISGAGTRFYLRFLPKF